MYFGIWQIIYIGLVAIALGISLAKQGEPKVGKYSVGSTLIAVAIEIMVLAFGGFFSK